jgi:hypothetical protein
MNENTEQQRTAEYIRGSNPVVENRTTFITAS